MKQIFGKPIEKPERPPITCKCEDHMEFTVCPRYSSGIETCGEEPCVLTVTTDNSKRQRVWSK